MRRKPANDRQPASREAGPLDHPASRQKHKSAFGLRVFDGFQSKALPCGPGSRLFTGITLIGKSNWRRFIQKSARRLLACFGTASNESHPSFRQLRIYRDGGAKQPRNQATCFGADDGGNEFALRHFGQRGDGVEMNIRDRPAGVQMFRRHCCGGDDAARSGGRQFQFLRQSQRKTAGVCGGNQFGGIGGEVFFLESNGSAVSVLQHTAPGTYNAGVSFRTTVPLGRSLPNDQLHRDTMRRGRNRHQYFVRPVAIPLCYDPSWRQLL